MRHSEFNIENIQLLITLLLQYFSNPKHVIGWLLLIFTLSIPMLIQNRGNKKTLKSWLKEHNIGKKY